MAKSAFMIAATSSGCGKTTVSLGIMRAMRRLGLSVQPFKCGPDYIDTQFHTRATGNNSINLDTFMSSEQHVADLFSRFASGKDVALVEGVMGLFDGYSKMSGSSAELSILLSIPVILVVNAASTAYSVAAIIYGFKNYNPSVKIAGVIFNRVSSESHFYYLKEACHDAGVECFGYLRKDDSLVTPSRHLGLTLTAANEMEKFIDKAADSVEETVDLTKILEATKVDGWKNGLITHIPAPRKVLALAYDEAFNFIYPANIEKFRLLGYEIKKFSPIHDSTLPKADFIYIPGGYPELFAKELSINVEMKQSICQYVEEDGKMWAECGGLIYICNELDGLPMCGILPINCTMDHAKLTLGYRTVDFGNNVIKGHEFHYSRLINANTLPSVASQTNAHGNIVNTPVYRYKNLLASYTHLYWADKDEILMMNV